jgi:hypothetical protein
VSATVIATVVKLMESLPDSVQDRVAEHLREYIEDLREELQWDTTFKKTHSQLVTTARRVKQEIEETAYLLRSPKNARRLRESVAELESGGGTERELVE